MGQALLLRWLAVCVPGVVFSRGDLPAEARIEHDGRVYVVCGATYGGFRSLGTFRVESVGLYEIHRPGTLPEMPDEAEAAARARLDVWRRLIVVGGETYEIGYRADAHTAA